MNEKKMNEDKNPKKKLFPGLTLYFDDGTKLAFDNCKDGIDFLNTQATVLQKHVSPVHHNI